jgi:hypothetical protein
MTNTVRRPSLKPPPHRTHPWSGQHSWGVFGGGGQSSILETFRFSSVPPVNYWYRNQAWTASITCPIFFQFNAITISTEDSPSWESYSSSLVTELPAFYAVHYNCLKFEFKQILHAASHMSSSLFIVCTDLLRRQEQKMHEHSSFSFHVRWLIMKRRLRCRLFAGHIC